MPGRLPDPLEEKFDDRRGPGETGVGLSDPRLPCRPIDRGHGQHLELAEQQMEALAKDQLRSIG